MRLEMRMFAPLPTREHWLQTAAASGTTRGEMARLFRIVLLEGPPRPVGEGLGYGECVFYC